MTVKDLEIQRKKIITTSLTYIKWVLIIIGISIALFIFKIIPSEGGSFEIFYTLSIITIILLILSIENKVNIFRQNYKRLMIPSIIEKITPNFLYEPQNTIDIDIILCSKLVLPDYTHFNGEDHIIFNTFGNLQICEIEVKKHLYKNRYVDYLTGLFGYATFPFNFEGTTVVQPRNYEFNTFNSKKIRLESPRFMDIWDVMSDDQIGARLALGTDIMNNLLYLNENIKTPISISFIGNRVYFAINQKSFLEPRFYNSVYNNETIQKFSKELSIIHDIVQTFKLRQNK